MMRGIQWLTELDSTTREIDLGILIKVLAVEGTKYRNGSSIETQVTMMTIDVDIMCLTS